MIKNIQILLILLCLFSCIQNKNTGKTEILADNETLKVIKEEDFEREDFFVFFLDFCTNEEFQLTRIKFPIKESFLSENLNEEIVRIIPEEEWKFLKIKKFEENTVNLYFDSFDNLELQDTNERVYSILGIENGININYYFTREKGKWYLVKIEDLST